MSTDGDRNQNRSQRRTTTAPAPPSPTIKGPNSPPLHAIPYLLPALDPLTGLAHPPPFPFTAPWHYELRFPCDPRGPGIARVTRRAVLTAHGLAELADRAELLTSELATNSVRHTKGPASVTLQWLHPVLRVSVRDMSPDLPDLPALPGPLGAPTVSLGAYADGGRGLLILGKVADRWGGCVP
ncbi:ATP-binding protein [Streptomyces sp. NPDC005423]|uniref:ATP-binding protein n=1 Tax=Streptomyces sp. NPDC005423 TaxID=3155343 RepID=UPI0033B2920B